MQGKNAPNVRAHKVRLPALPQPRWVCSDAGGAPLLLALQDAAVSQSVPLDLGGLSRRVIRRVLLPAAMQQKWQGF